MDPDMKKTYRGTDGTVGFVSAWDSEKDDVGKGEQEIIKITDGERIDYELRFQWLKLCHLLHCLDLLSRFQPSSLP